MSEITHPIEAGAMIRVKDRRDPVTIEEYIGAEEADDGHAYYLCSSPSGFNDVDALHEDVTEVVLTRQQVAERRVPSPEALAKAIDLFEEPRDGAFLVDETDVEGDDAQLRGPIFSINVYGKTKDGLRFSALVTVSDVQEVDF